MSVWLWELQESKGISSGQRWTKAHDGQTISKKYRINHLQKDVMREEAEVGLEITSKAHQIAEIIAAFRILKNGKAPGHGTLNVELCKANPEPAASTLHGTHVHNNPVPCQSPFSHEGVISDVVVFEFGHY